MIAMVSGVRRWKGFRMVKRRRGFGMNLETTCEVEGGKIKEKKNIDWNGLRSNMINKKYLYKKMLQN